MTTCNRYEQEALLMVERGEQLDEHFSNCEDCLIAHEKYKKFKQKLGEIDQTIVPPAGWQDKVWKRIESEEKSLKNRPWRVALPLGLAAAAAFFMLRIMLPISAPAGLEISVVSSGIAYRSLDAKSGDSLNINAETGQSRYAQIRIYRNDNLIVLECSDQPPCVREKSNMTTTYKISSIGTYQALLINSDEPIPASGMGFDRDTEAALDANANVTLAKAIIVR